MVVVCGPVITTFGVVGVDGRGSSTRISGKAVEVGVGHGLA